TDFGLALALRGDGRFGGATSRSGTPQFAAPEQLLGERVDQRADLYSLAAASYFALLGRPPFEGRTPEAILARQTTDDVPALNDARHDVRRELEEVLRRAVCSAGLGAGGRLRRVESHKRRRWRRESTPAHGLGEYAGVSVLTRDPARRRR